MVILLTILLGALAGWLASMIMGRDNSLGWFGNILVGVVGAGIGKFVLSLFQGGAVNFAVVNFVDVLVAVLGAVILLAIVNFSQTGRVR